LYNVQLAQCAKCRHVRTPVLMQDCLLVCNYKHANLIEKNVNTKQAICKIAVSQFLHNCSMLVKCLLKF